VPIEYFLAGVGVGALAVKMRYRGVSDGTDAVGDYLDERESALRQRYETGPMDYLEFGDRVAVIEAPGTERIMRAATRVDGIGPETAFELAAYFDGDYEAFRRADRAEFERVNGVGENRATALGLVVG
jgi:hypothetical protein